jgi:hypothetical protein
MTATNKRPAVAAQEDTETPSKKSARTVEPAAATEDEGIKLVNYSNILTKASTAPAVSYFYTNLFPILTKTLVAKDNDPSGLNDILKATDGLSEKVHDVRLVAQEALKQYEPIKMSIKEELEALTSLRNDDLKEFVHNARAKTILDPLNKKKFNYVATDQAIRDEITHCENMIKAGKLILNGRAMGVEVALLQHINDHLESLFKKPIPQPDTQDFGEW